MPAQIPAQDNAIPLDAFSFPKEGDFSGLGWSQAFFAVHDFFSRTYALGDWKKIPWDLMAAYYGQKIVAAEASGDNGYPPDRDGGVPQIFGVRS